MNLLQKLDSQLAFSVVLMGSHLASHLDLDDCLQTAIYG